MLGGWITNRNFKVSVDGGIYVLRVGADTELLGIDRRAEHEASLAAAAVGVGPEVVAFIEPEGFLVDALHRGRGRRAGNPGAGAAPPRVAQARCAIHGGPPIPASTFPAAAYAATAAAHGVPLPAASSARGRRPGS